MVVCTLCSCYPSAVLGLPPVWYKSAAYRSRAIAPRGVLREFGTQIDEDVEVRAWDSTAELRYIVIPERPADTENLSEAELAELGLPLYLCGGACSLHQKVKRVPDNFGGKGQSLEVVLIQEIFIASRVISNLLADNE